MNDQLTMTGDDWTSDRDRKKQQKAERVRHAAGIKAAKTLHKAREALHAYLLACRECQDGSDDTIRGISDSRHALMDNLSEYAGFLEFKHQSKGGAA